MKRMQKGSDKGSFQVTWIEVSYTTGRAFECSRSYETLEAAELNAEIARSHKTKSSVSVMIPKACPDSAEVIAHRTSVGGTWNSTQGLWLYSASY